MRRPIAIGLSPNLEFSDILRSFSHIISPFTYQKGDKIGLLEQWFRTFFGVPYAVSFNSGRGALYALLKTVGIGSLDEVLVQAFTCAAVPNAVIWLGAIPIYVDVNNSFTMNPKDLERKISKKTKVIVVQHTFGIPASLDLILKIAKVHNLWVIEDCAHVLGEEFKGKKLGTFGDAALFSFGRDKAFSSVFGGMAITKNRELGKKLRTFQKTLELPSFFWIFQQLFHPLASFVILPLYNFLIGKIFLFLLQKIRLISFPVTSKEKQARLEDQLIKKLPNALASLALFQLKRLRVFNSKRKVLSRLYIKELGEKFDIPYKKEISFLRFPILVEDRDAVMVHLRKHSVYVGKWYSEIIDPKGIDLKKMFYQRGSCPNAELLVKKILNLPCYPTLEKREAQRVIALLKNYAKP